ncbi:MAG: hypothetical protein COB85_05585 [Bacteroidetes bacterium]|nr:MAG: hypothetical protein COB85_05585 [Bacteroidota bacterium]
MGYGKQSQACISDTITTITVTVNYESFFLSPCTYTSNIEIRLSNLSLMTESPGKVCACAFAFGNFYDSVIFIAFVDSGTNNPYQGFAMFNEELASSTAWDNDQPGFGGWAGYIASVVNLGLVATDPVEMVIRAAASASNLLAYQDSLNCVTPAIYDVVPQTSIATDEWVSLTSSLGNTHQKVRGLTTVMSYQIQNTSCFAGLDSAILNNIPVVGIETIEEQVGFSVVPNPFSHEIMVTTGNRQSIILYRIYDLGGNLVRSEDGLNAETLVIDRGNLSGGMYFLELLSEKAVLGRQKIVVQ